MSETISVKTPHYCYHCGNRLIKKSENCWYCGVPVHREIRSVRRCPFCAEPVRHEALKCRHCGEFLDGRPRVEQKPVQQMVVIDKDVLKTMSDLRLFPGLPVPESARKVLDAETVKAIEENRPDEIQRPGVQLLPAPDSAPITVEGEPVMLEDKSGGPSGAPLAKREAGAEPPPAKGKKLPLMPMGQAGGEGGGKRLPIMPMGPREGEASMPPARRKPLPLAPWKKGKRARAEAEAEGDDAIDAEVSETFRNCANCGTEILVLDNFCYHCGTQYRRTQTDQLRAARERRRKVAKMMKVLLVLLILAGGGAAAYYYFGKDKVEEAADKVLKGAKGAVEKGMEKLGMGDKEATAKAKQCSVNLIAIQSAKMLAAEKLDIKSGPVDLAAVLAEMNAEELPKCPSGGTYTLNELQEFVTCSVGDNGTATKSDDHVPQPPG